MQVRNRYNSTFRIRDDAAKTSRPKRARLVRRNGRCRLKANGRRTNDWIKVRRELSAEFAARGITSCELGYEGCWRDIALGFAHGRKRRHLRGDELHTLTALICNPCHDKIEVLPAAEMLAIIQLIITNRKKAA